MKHSLLLQKAHMDTLDRDVSRIAKLLADWYLKEFSEDPIGKAQAVTTRSGKEVKSPQMESKSDDLPIVQEMEEESETVEVEKDREVEQEKEPPIKIQPKSYQTKVPYPQ